jgi:hypothetical protein
MALTPSERAARVIGTSGLRPPEGETLKGAIQREIAEALREEREGLRDTLRLCVAAIEEALTASTLPGPIRTSLRVCRGLCLDALTEDEADTVQ